MPSSCRTCSDSRRPLVQNSWDIPSGFVFEKKKYIFTSIQPSNYGIMRGNMMTNCDILVLRYPQKNKGPDNPTRRLLPIMSTKCCSGDGEGSATTATSNAGKCLQVPCLPRKMKVDVTIKCHACHAKCRGAPGNQRQPSAPPSATSDTPATPNAGKCLEVLRLPRETKVDVTKCHPCHAKRRCVKDGVSKMVCDKDGV